MSFELKSYRAPVEATFTFPDKPDNLQKETGFKSVTLRELSPGAESAALSRAAMDGAKLMHELVKESLVRAVKVEGETMEITTADETVDIFWSSLGPKGRTLVTAAYNHINQPKPAEAADFLASASISVR